MSVFPSFQPLKMLILYFQFAARPVHWGLFLFYSFVASSQTLTPGGGTTVEGITSKVVKYKSLLNYMVDFLTCEGSSYIANYCLGESYCIHENGCSNKGYLTGGSQGSKPIIDRAHANQMATQ